MTIRSMLMTAALLAPLAAAGAQPSAPDSPMAAHAGRDGPGHRQEMARDLAIVLRLTPAQQPALASWMQAMMPPRRDWHGDKDGAAGTTTPERLAAEQRRMAAHQAEGASRIAATQRFYAQLDPQQRTVFDALDRLRHDRHHGMHGHGMHGHGMHGHEMHGQGGRHPGGPGDVPPPGVSG